MDEPREDPTLQVRPGAEAPPSINPVRTRTGPRRLFPVAAYVDGIRSADRVMLGRAITLIESEREDHQKPAQEVIERCLPHAGRSMRIGITGVPGVGKSTLIEALGSHYTGLGKKVAVLAIDPSSARSRGSILGDKTRMPRLSADPAAFIRPSPTGGSLGGVARKTRETIVLCEAAGYEVIFVETVGVGQSETAVHSMVDFFLLLVLAGAGDELQGIKRGIIEMADALVVTKADGGNRQAARLAQQRYTSALHLFPPPLPGWEVPVLTCSALEADGILELVNTFDAYARHTRGNGVWEDKRRRQALHWFHQTIEAQLREQFYGSPEIRARLPGLEAQVLAGTLSPFVAGQQLLRRYHGGGDDTALPRGEDA